MATPSIAHFGTTLPEDVPPDGAVQIDVPFTGSLARTDRFLQLFGMELLITNMYPGVGRQYIYRRGERSDVDYVEKDTFTSYTSTFAPDPGAPRVADTVFRLPHPDPRAVWGAWEAEGLVELLHDDGIAVLFRGPDHQVYELVPSSDDPVDNHAIFIWTDPGEADVIEKDYDEHFGLQVAERGVDFHGLGDAVLLVRQDPPVTIGLLTPKTGGRIEPRWTDDVFAQVGYSHFRLGAPDKAKVKAMAPEAFPDTGDVSYVHFHHAYLELVETP